MSQNEKILTYVHENVDIVRLAYGGDNIPKYISDVIGQQYQQWEGRDEVYIQTPTGSGKTTFVLQILSNHARQMRKEVLVVENRKILKNQIKMELLYEHGVEEISNEELAEIRSFEGITVVSYQELQEELKRKHWTLTTLFEERFRYVVFDEIHYLLQDATFNRDIPYILNAMPKIRNATKIFLSATLEEVYPFLWDILHKDKIIPWEEVEKSPMSVGQYRDSTFTFGQIYYYYLEPRYQISSMEYIEKLEEISKLINEDNTDEKWLIFVNSKSEAKKFKGTIECETAYMDADIDEEDEIKQKIVKESRFADKVLITTKVLDNGINLIDEKLRNIVLLTTEKTEFIQMLGRKRFTQDKDHIRLFIMKRSGKYFNWLRNMQIIPTVHYLEELQTDNSFNQKYFDDKEFYRFCQNMTLIEDGKIKVSRAAREKIRLELEFCDYMIPRLKEDEDAFVKEQLSWIGKEAEFKPEGYVGAEDKIDLKTQIADFLKQLVSKKMNKEEQKNFREEFARMAKESGEKLTDRPERPPGIVVINKLLKRESIPFVVKSISNSTYWMIEEVETIE